MKYLILFISFLFFGCAAQNRVKDDPIKLQEATKRKFDVSKDIAWRAVISALTERSFNIVSSDKDSGLIKATRSVSFKNADTQRILLGVSNDSGTAIFNALVEEIKPNSTLIKINISGQVNSTEVVAFGIENKRTKGVANIMTIDVLNKWFGLIENEINLRK